MVIKILLSFERKQKKPDIVAHDTYPRLVSGKEFGISKRLMARSGMAHVGNQLFLGHCNIHKKYYLDRKHTKDVIRCPICDTQWLREQGFIKENNHQGTT